MHFLNLAKGAGMGLGSERLESWMLQSQFQDIGRYQLGGWGQTVAAAAMKANSNCHSTESEGLYFQQPEEENHEQNNFYLNSRSRGTQLVISYWPVLTTHRDDMLLNGLWGRRECVEVGMAAIIRMKAQLISVGWVPVGFFFPPKLGD